MSLWVLAPHALFAVILIIAIWPRKDECHFCGHTVNEADASMGTSNGKSVVAHKKCVDNAGWKWKHIR